MHPKIRVKNEAQFVKVIGRAAHSAKKRLYELS